jgi:hypothetical protein
MSVPDDLDAAAGPLVAAFGALGVVYRVVGSVASSALGVARSTLDVDLLVALRPAHVAPLVERLQEAYYVDAGAVRDAVAHGGTFNVIHLDTVLKVDVYVAHRAWDAEVLRRGAGRGIPIAGGADELALSSPEDVVVSKLEWFDRGGRTSERQWGDVLGVLRVQGDALDFAYMRRWASELGVSELLEKALAEAGGAG